MKKLIILSAASLLAVASRAQVNIDWAVSEIINPTQLTSTVSGTSFNGTFAMKNMGTDSAFPGDTILYRVAIRQASNGAALLFIPSSNGVIFTVLNKTLATDDTVHVNLQASAPVYVTLSADIMYEVSAILINRSRGLPGETTSNNTLSKNMVWYNPQGWGVSTSTINMTELGISPNPTNNSTTVTLPLVSATQASIISAYNTAGQLVYSSSINPGQSQATINTQSWATGSYIVQVTQGENIYTQKLIKL